MNIPGYAGRILYVDLGSETTEVKPLDEKWAKEYLGGWGVNYRLAYDLVTPGGDPFSPDSPIILGLGPFVGTLYPGSAKVTATCKMPMTATSDGKHFVATSTGGSSKFSLMLKAAGYDHLVILGRAKTPVYLKIVDDQVQFCNAGDLWGQKNVYETTNILDQRHKGFGTITIGKAGENKVRFAMSYVDKNWHLGKSGFGAIMGSKNLKAIVVRGSKGVRVADPERFMKVVNSVRAMIDFNPKSYIKEIRRIGFHALWDLIWQHNFYQSPRWTKKEFSKYWGVKSIEKVYDKGIACASCPVGCKTVCSVKEGPYKGQRLDTTHYSGAACVADRFDQLENLGGPMKFIEVANEYGMDFLNAVSMVDWVTQLYREKGITKEKTEGMDLLRTMDTYLSLLTKIANREGALGNAMADGWFALSRFVGRDGTEDYIFGNQVAKGNECIYPAKASKLDAMRITMLMTNPRGGQSPQGHSVIAVPLRPLKAIKRDLSNAGLSKEEFEKIFSEDDFDHALLTRHIEDAYGVYNALGVCTVYATFGWTNVKVLAEAYSALTGIETNPEELKKKGERIMNFYKLLNVREGFTRVDDRPPKAVFKPIQTPEGLQQLEDYYRKKAYSMEDCERLLDDYYQSRGWDIKKGIPTRDKLKDLNLEEFSEGLSFV